MYKKVIYIEYINCYLSCNYFNYYLSAGAEDFIMEGMISGDPTTNKIYKALWLHIPRLIDTI